MFCDRSLGVEVCFKTRWVLRMVSGVDFFRFATRVAISMVGLEGLDFDVCP